jgi:hypothetical protein
MQAKCHAKTVHVEVRGTRMRRTYQFDRTPCGKVKAYEVGGGDWCFQFNDCEHNDGLVLTLYEHTVDDNNSSSRTLYWCYACKWFDYDIHKKRAVDYDRDPEKKVLWQCTDYPIERKM